MGDAMSGLRAQLGWVPALLHWPQVSQTWAWGCGLEVGGRVLQAREFGGHLESQS